MSVLRSVRPAASALRVAAARPAARTLLRAAVPAARAAVSARSFSVTRSAQASGTSDLALASRLKEEIKYEEDNAPREEPEFLTEFKKQGIWEIKEKAGSDDVELLRTFGNENIRVYFSISDIDNEQPAFEEDEQEEDEEEEEDEENEEDEEVEDMEGMEPPTYTIRCHVSITKPNQGALVMELSAEDGEFLIDGANYYSDAKAGIEMSAEADYERRGLYVGPSFDNLDTQVQEEFENYIKERGLNEQLAEFIPDFAEWKEQKEYVRWLKNTAKFIEA